MHDLRARTKDWYRLQWLDLIALLQIYSTEIECLQQYNMHETKKSADY